MHIYIVRHGQTDWNLDQRTQGQIDIELNETGKKQSDRLTNILADYPIEHVISSDLLRCRYTAEQLKTKTGLSIEYNPLLRERYYGEWEGKKNGELIQHIFQNSIDADGKYDRLYTPPTVESLKELWIRCEKIYDKIYHLNKNVLIITHGGTKSMLLSLLLKGDVYSVHSYNFNNTALTELKRYDHPDFPEIHTKEHTVFRLLRYNCTDHLL